MNTAAALLALGLVWPISRRLGLAYGALVAVMVLPPLLMGGATSIGRMTSVLFPIFIWLAERTERHRTPILILFATLQGFAAVLFFTWRELYLTAEHAERGESRTFLRALRVPRLL